MKRAHIFGTYVMVIVAAIIACYLPASSERIQWYISGTQTAEAYSNITPTEKVTEPTENIPDSPEIPSRCDLFSELELPVFLLEVFTNSPNLVIYVEFPDGVIGLEDDTDDGAPWEYSATLGDMQSLWCADFDEVEHAGRLYCMLPLPKEYHNAVRPLSLNVNLCDHPVVWIPQQSLVVEEQHASGSNYGSSVQSPEGPDEESNSEPGSEGFQGIFGIFTTVCGAEPASHTYENNGYREWCECMGGENAWEVWYNMAGIEDGIMQYCTFP